MTNTKQTRNRNNSVAFFNFYDKTHTIYMCFIYKIIQNIVQNVLMTIKDDMD